MNTIRIRQICAGALTLCMIAACSACSGGNSKTEVSSDSGANSDTNSSTTVTAATKKAGVDGLQLAYDGDDTLSPLTVKRVTNRQLIPLIYDVLISTDEQFSPVAAMAKSYSLSGSTCTVVLKSNLLFWDGSKVTAKDAAASLMALKNKSSCLWSEQLSQVSSVDAKDDVTLVIHLKKANILFASCLNFPVMKDGTFSDSQPVGSGRFSVQSSGKDKAQKLVKNTRYRLADQITQKAITLLEFPDSKAVLNAIKNGEVDLSYASAAKFSGFQTGCSYRTCQALDLVFLGMNLNKSPLNNEKLRRAIYDAIDRGMAVTSGYSGFGQKAFFPYHPATVEYAGTLFETASFSPNTAKSLLDEAYPKDSGNALPTLTLLVQKTASHQMETARLIVSALGKVGLTVNLDEQSTDSYRKKVKNGDYEFYLGETLLPQDLNMDLFFDSNALTKGASGCDKTISAWNNYRQGKGELSDYLTAFSNEVPFVPVLFVQHLALISRKISFPITAAQDNLFVHMESWQVKDGESSTATASNQENDKNAATQTTKGK